MKPKRLKIQAFGSFADTQEIDFAQFGDHPMILINGPTGAGKSTILDAICFALYGQTSADDREASQMRAQYADPSMLSEIEFDFSLGASGYRIRRVPQQKRPKKRGEGETDHNAEAQVWKLAGDTTEVVINRGMSQATDYIESLLGLNADQFRQVMVLPQGRFRDLLVAKSTDREKIFSTLFNSAIYKRIEDSLKAQAKVIQNQVQSSTDQAEGKLKLVGMDDERALTEAITQLEPQVQQLDSNRIHAQEQVVRATKSLEQAQNLIKVFESAEQLRLKLTELESSGKSLDSKRIQIRNATAAIRLLPLYQTLESAQVNVKTREEELKKQSALLDTVGAQEKQAIKSLEALSTAIESSADDKKLLAELEQLLVRHDAIQPRLVTLEAAQSKYQDSELAHKKVSIDLASSKVQLNKQEQALERDRQAVESLNELELSLSVLVKSAEARKIYEGNLLNQQSLNTKISESQPLLQTLSETLEKQSKALSVLELHWHTGAAVALAAQLGTDMPCPVCGSIEHPHPANADGEHAIVDHAQVEHARAELNRLRREHQEKQVQLTKWQEEYDRLGEVNERLVQSDTTLVNESLKAIEQRYQEQQAACIKLRSIKATIAESENTIRTGRQALLSLEQRVMEKLAVKSEANALLEASSKEYQDALEAIPVEYQKKRVLQRKIDTLRMSLNKLAQEHDDAEKQLQATRLDLAKNTSLLSAMNKELLSERKELESRDARAKAQLAESVFVDVEAFKNACLSEEQVNVIRKELDEHEKLYNKTQGELEAALKVLESRKLPDISALTAIQTEVSALFASAQEQWQKERDRLKQYTDVQNSIDENLAATAKLRAEYESIGRLSSVASGQSETRISLQRFVLSVLLDDVLLDASKRMLIMSRSRYQLVRREEGGGRQAAGLELDVLDTYSGKSRPVSTLSGGESFQAALALALGLSDVVQSYSGGIRLDTLFIDEGFGSLDTEALELAIKTLTDLQSSGRTIGVISHVTEMKEQITQRLDIRPSPSGSQIHAVT